MFGYIVRRLVSAFLVVVLTSMIVFAAVLQGPTNPAQPLVRPQRQVHAGEAGHPDRAARLQRPVVHQYGIWVGGLFQDREIDFGATYHCDAPCLGISYRTRTEVTDRAGRRSSRPPSRSRSAAPRSTSRWACCSAPLPPETRDRDRPRAGRFSVVVSAIPYYVVALMAWIYISLKWKLIEDTTYHPLTENPVAWATGLLLPWACIGLTFSTSYARYSRGQMIETLGEDYVRTAVAKGSRGAAWWSNHALRAAIVPDHHDLRPRLRLPARPAPSSPSRSSRSTASVAGPSRPSSRRPTSRSSPRPSCSPPTVIVLANLIVDLLYAVIDPRVRLA